MLVLKTATETDDHELSAENYVTFLKVFRLKTLTSNEFSQFLRDVIVVKYHHRRPNMNLIQTQDGKEWTQTEDTDCVALVCCGRGSE